MKYKHLLYIGIALILISFNRNYDSPLDLNSQNQINDSIVIKWKNDSLGCQNIRNIDLCKDIINKFDLINEKSEKVRIYLGNPNKIVKEINWIYYNYSECDSNILIDSLDKSWVTVRFNKDFRLEKVFFGCN